MYKLGSRIDAVLYMYVVVVKISRSLSHLLMSTCSDTVGVGIGLPNVTSVTIYMAYMYILSIVVI